MSKIWKDRIKEKKERISRVCGLLKEQIFTETDSVYGIQLFYGDERSNMYSSKGEYEAYRDGLIDGCITQKK